jgi:pilus assembly protein CpaF
VFDVAELVRVETLTTSAAAILQEAIECRENILIGGGTGAGKTTLLNALAGLVPDEDRIVLIEETAELRIDAPHLVRFESRREQPGVPAVTIGNLVRAAMRHRPDRLFVGEVRGGEGFDVLQAWNTGHDGSISTIHASSAAQMPDRFTSCVLQSGIELPYAAIRHAIAGCVQWCAYMARVHDRRVLTELVRIVGYDAARDAYNTEDFLNVNA